MIIQKPKFIWYWFSLLAQYWFLSRKNYTVYGCCYLA